MYDDASYANSRLQGTVVRLKDGSPILIEGATGGSGPNIQFSYTRLDGKGSDNIYLKDIDLEPVPLGFVNAGSHGISYLARMPMQRDWRQGMRSSNTRSLYGLDHREVNSKQTANTIINNFPKFLTAYNKCLKAGISVAFHRHFAVVKGRNKEAPNLIYKWHGVVGDIINGQVKLKKKWLHLNNLVEELAV